jgi:hypothetical protein
MKKTLLSLGLAVLAFGGFAQETTDCSVKENGVTENYAGAAAPAGVFYWGNAKEETTGQEPSFLYERNTETQALDITVNHADTVAAEADPCETRQKKNIWAPMGIDINYATAEDTEKFLYVNASENPSGSALLKNPGEKTVEVYFAISSNVSTGDSPSVVNATLIDGALSVWGGKVAPGEELMQPFDLTNAVNRIWVEPADACGVCAARGGKVLSGNDCIIPNDFDPSMISGAEFTVNEQTNAAPWNGPLVDYVVNLDYVKFGNCIPLGLESNAAASGFEVYPNPAQGVINFNHTVNGSVEVELSNTLGSTVSATTGSSMNVAELPAGIYFATLKVNGVATAVQRVQVQ